jgi:fructokinase
VNLSDDELEFLTGERDAEAFRPGRWHDGLQVVTVTRGRDGCTVLTPDGGFDLPSFEVIAVDTTGAGDGFMAGLLAGLVREPGAMTDREALRGICRFACAVGALTTMERGAIPALPTRAAVEAFLAARAA